MAPSPSQYLLRLNMPGRSDRGIPFCVTIFMSPKHEQHTVLVCSLNPKNPPTVPQHYHQNFCPSAGLRPNTHTDCDAWTRDPPGPPPATTADLATNIVDSNN